MVSGQHAQTAGIDRQRLSEGKFGAEVGHLALMRNAAAREPGFGRAHVSIKILNHPVKAPQKVPIQRQCVQRGL